MAFRPLNDNERFKTVDYKYTNVAERFAKERRRLKALAEEKAAQDAATKAEQSRKVTTIKVKGPGR